jgi:hypothetical protein
LDYWKEGDIFWGAGNQAGMLLGVPAGGRTQDPVDFRDQTDIYVLYADYAVVYVGQTGVKNQTHAANNAAPEGRSCW